MSVWEIIAGVILLVVTVVTIILVVVQDSPKGGISALTGGDSYFNKNQGRTLDSLLAKATKYALIVLFVVTILGYAAIVYLK